MFLDFGCVRRFEPPMIAAWKQLARAILADDRGGFAAGFTALGFVGKAKGFDWDYQLARDARRCTGRSSSPASATTARSSRAASAR